MLLLVTKPAVVTQLKWIWESMIVQIEMRNLERNMKDLAADSAEKVYIRKVKTKKDFPYYRFVAFKQLELLNKAVDYALSVLPTKAANIKKRDQKSNKKKKGSVTPEQSLN